MLFANNSWRDTFVTSLALKLHYIIHFFFFGTSTDKNGIHIHTQNYIDLLVTKISYRQKDLKPSNQHCYDSV